MSLDPKKDIPRTEFKKKTSRQQKRTHGESTSIVPPLLETVRNFDNTRCVQINYTPIS